MDPRLRAGIALAVDLLLVALFAVIGRASHREDESALLVTWWPFAAGTLAGWAVARGWRSPFGFWPTGIAAWLGTVAVGMLLRVVTGQGVQVAFVVVATIVLGALLIGWRALLVSVDRASTRGADSPGPIAYFLRRRR